MPDDVNITDGPQGYQDPDVTLPSAESRHESIADPKLPSIIGRYRIIHLLGERGMGAVYEAEQDRPRRHVALKVIKAAWYLKRGNSIPPYRRSYEGRSGSEVPALPASPTSSQCPNSTLRPSTTTISNRRCPNTPVAPFGEG